jgi:hypothetical protein
MMKKCPFCAEEIKDEAIVCKHCGRDLRTGQTGQQQAVPAAYTYLGIDYARKALSNAIVGIFFLGFIAGPAAIICARKAKKILKPGEFGYGKAQAGEIIGWIIVGIYILAIVSGGIVLLVNALIEYMG